MEALQLESAKEAQARGMPGPITKDLGDYVPLRGGGFTTRAFAKKFGLALANPPGDPPIEEVGLTYYLVSPAIPRQHIRRVRPLTPPPRPVLFVPAADALTKLRSRPVRDPSDHHCPDFLARLFRKSNWMGRPFGARRITASIVGRQRRKMTG